eukprot:jgi/Tetstr1/459903/TSEL_005245.t1
MARVQSSTPGGGVDWHFRCFDGSCGRTYLRPAPLWTHVIHGMESDDPAVAAMHLAYAATFDPSVYARASTPAPAPAAHDAALAATARWCATSDVYRKELRRARQALDTDDLGMVFDAVAALPTLDALHPSPTATGPEYSPPEEPPDLQRAPPSWGDNANEIRRGTVFALYNDDPAAREERGKSGEPLRVRPLGVGSVLVRLASAHALGQVGADAREVMGPVQHSFQSGGFCETAYMSMREALQLFGGRGTGGKGLLPEDIRNDFNEVGVVYLGAPISHYPEWMTGALGRRREAHATLLERIASFGTSGYGCHHGAMRLLVVCAV